MNEHKKVVIIGAGISGLTIGNILAKRGLKVTIIEKESDIGGLARSVKYDGFTYDYGPHGLFENSGKAGRFIEGILKDELLTVPKKSGVLLMNRYYDWPLKPDIIAKLPWGVKFKAIFDLIYRKRYVGDSLKEYLLNRYGHTLYKIDFEPYTKKFLNIDPLQLDPDWMRIGIKRAGAGERLRMDSLWQILFSLFKRKSEYFAYPKGGAMQFPKALAKEIIEAGGRIFTNTEAVKINVQKNIINYVSTNTDTFEADLFIWTAPITVLDGLLLNGLAKKQELDYISMVFYNIAVNEPPSTEYRWCYFVDSDIFFPRCSISTLFSPLNSPQGKMALTAELTCRHNSELWHYPEKYKDRVINDLWKLGLIRKTSNIEGVYIERLEYAYPIYRLGYREKLKEIEDRSMQYSNLRLAGRQGTFWYCNMDHCVEQGIDIAECIIRDLHSK